MTKFYVVYGVNHYQDGTDDFARIEKSLESALELANEWGKEASGCIPTVQIFELGKEILIEKVKNEVPQPPVVTSKYQIKKSTKTKKS